MTTGRPLGLDSLPMKNGHCGRFLQSSLRKGIPPTIAGEVKAHIQPGSVNFLDSYIIRYNRYITIYATKKTKFFYNELVV